jgi:hypothetical protein
VGRRKAPPIDFALPLAPFYFRGHSPPKAGRLSLAILKFYLLSRFAGLPKSEKEFLLLQNLIKSCYIKVVLNNLVAYFIGRLGQFERSS